MASRDARPTKKSKKSGSKQRARVARKIERVTLDDWRALVRDVARAKTAVEARAIDARYKANGREWELPAFLEAGEGELEAFGEEVSRVLGDRIKAVKAGGDLWSALLALRDEVFDS